MLHRRGPLAHLIVPEGRHLHLRAVGHFLLRKHPPVPFRGGIEEVVVVRLAPRQAHHLRCLREVGLEARLKIPGAGKGLAEGLGLERRGAHALAVGRVKAAQRIPHGHEAPGTLRHGCVVAKTVRGIDQLGDGRFKGGPGQGLIERGVRQGLGKFKEARLIIRRIVPRAPP